MMTPLNLPNYQQLDTIYTGNRTLVYRAIRHSDDQPVIIKILRNLHPSFNELLQFRNQFVITRNISSPFIVQSLALERYGNGYALLMPDEGAVALQHYWQNQPQTHTELFAIALQLADALHTLSQNRIIHKDIKPANIIIHPKTQQVQLIDFSIASLLPKEQQQLVNPNRLEGTLAYISPEQTGRMNRGLDYRTDFYSLGVTLYELLTGQLPFSLSEPMELVHCHIAQTPIAPVDLLDAQGQPYPAMLSAIIMKLMMKNAEDRYQSALGLKHDLERCVRSLEETGEITEFELGQRDVCDRFNIPEKLYGREQEVQTLLDCFDHVANGNREMVLVAGFSGIGKTAVINEVQKPIVEKRGYFIKGKFDQYNRNVPFNAVVQAFQDLIEQLRSESDTALENWRTKILEAVGNNGQVLLEVIPELVDLIGPQPAVPELTGSAAQGRFQRIFSQLIHVFGTAEHPLVIFLDDLQWADLASLHLLQSLLTEAVVEHLLILGAYRDNEVSAAHPLMLSLADLQAQGVTPTTITLAPLAIAHINQLVSETLSCAAEVATALTTLIYPKTQGNPFFTTQLLLGLHAENQIIFDYKDGSWMCDLVQIQDAVLTDDVVTFITGRLAKLSPVTQQVLQLAACIGNQFDLTVLAIVAEVSETEIAQTLWSALQSRFVLPISQNYKFFQDSRPEQYEQNNASVGYRFLHDRVQQAAYALIPEGQTAETHLKIGRLLQQNTPARSPNDNLFAMVNQLNLGRELMTEPAEQLALAQLNLKAGNKASLATAYTAALDYLNTGLELLPTNAWQQEYHLTLMLHNSTAQAAFLSGDFAQQESLTETVLASAQTYLDQVKVHEVKIQACQAQGQLLEAIAVAREILAQLGVTFPDEPTHADIEQGLAATKAVLTTKTTAEILAIAPMRDPEKLAIVRILASVTGAAYGAAFNLMALMGLQLIKLSLQAGNTAESALGYAIYGVVLCELVEDLEAGYGASLLALGIFEQCQASALKAQIFVFVYDLIWHWKEPIQKILTPLREGYSSGLEMGDPEWGSFSALIYCYHAYFMGQELTDLAIEMANFSDAIIKIKQDVALNYHQITQQAVLNLLGESTNPCQLIGSAYDETTRLPQHIESGDRTAVCFMAVHKLILCNLFGDLAIAETTATLAREYLDGATGSVYWPIFYFHDSLTQLALCDQATSLEQEKRFAQVTTNQEKLGFWAKIGSVNHQQKFQLIAAEIQWRLGNKTAAIDLYDAAIMTAKENKYIQEEALANELAAKFYLGWDKDKIATVYMQEAYYCYARWGAKAKTDHLEANYPELLTPILQKQRVEFNAIDSLTSLTQSLTTSLQTQSSTRISEALDLATILQAAQKLASTIELQQLLKDITTIILTNSGAQKVALLTPDAQQWQIQVSAEQGVEGNTSIQTTSHPLDSQSLVPIRLIQYVKNTQESVLISEATTEISGILEGYLLKSQPQSVLCVPLLNQGELVAIAYLEHPTTKGVFTPNRQTIIEFLCAQAAVALQNAQLYQQAQQSQAKAEQALVDLQDAQIQLVQSEKMSALGNLVAGVAHEINNPVGFLQGNIQPAQDYVKDLLGLIDLYQAKMPNPDADIEDEIEAIDLEFVREDLPKLISSMNAGVDRIRNISNSLRTFSRKDQEHKIAFNIHNGMDSTLLILKHRTKANEQRPTVQIFKNYGELPEVQCFPGQLNQVFMNILANAIDAFDEANQGKTYQEIETNPNQITIATLVVDGQVKIQLQDNGCGMKPETVERIFEQGFTTKEVGKGTGLGMAIAHQIITEKHGGAIACTSALGKGTSFTITLPL